MYELDEHIWYARTSTDTHENHLNLDNENLVASVLFNYTSDEAIDDEDAFRMRETLFFAAGRMVFWFE